jgi:hypothetical protein
MIEIDQLNDRRTAERTEVVASARVRRIRGKSSNAYGVAITDVSLIGMSFLTSDIFRPGDIVVVTLSDIEVRFELHGYVRRVDRHPHTDRINVIGVEYLRTPSTEAVATRVASWLQSRR